MGSISMPQGGGNRKHNLRGYADGEVPDNIDLSRTHLNIVWKDETTTHAYHRIFDEAVSEYNSKQKRKDRKIKDYRTHILNSKNGENEFYEDILQWGTKDDFANDPELWDVAKECLLEYIEEFEERNPGLELIGAYIHMDEASPHMHFDYIPTAVGYKTGMNKRNSLDRAMKHIIYIRTGKEYSPRPSEKDESGKCIDNATKQWKEMERVHFRKICISRGLLVDKEIKTPERDNLSVLEYKAEKRKEEIKELENEANKLQGVLSNLNKMIDNAQKKLDDVKEEGARIIDDAKTEANRMVEKAHNIWDKLISKVGLISDDKVKDARRDMMNNYHRCEKYLTDEMKSAFVRNDFAKVDKLATQMEKDVHFGKERRDDTGLKEVLALRSSIRRFIDLRDKKFDEEEIIEQLETSKRKRGLVKQ